MAKLVIPDSRNENPIVIDFGSCFTRAGFSNEADPTLNFRSLVAKKADVKSKIIGDSSLSSSLSPFYNDVPQNFPLVENIMDHIFSNLGCNGNSIPNHVVLTEPVSVFTESRAAMCQLMFECYRVPSLNFGVDALFSYIYNAQKNPLLYSDNSLILRSGYSTTHAMVVLDGKLDPSHTLRIDVGGHHSTELLQKVLNVSYPNHKVSYALSNQLKENYCYVATDYQQELTDWKLSLSKKESDQGKPFTKKNPVIHSMPKGKAKLSNNSTEKPENEQLTLQRKERMKEMQEKRKSVKLQQMQEMKDYVDQMAALKTENFEEYQSQLQADELTEQDLTKQQNDVKVYFQKLEGIEEVKEEKVHDFSLIDMDVETLSEDQKKERKKQVFLHGQIEFRQRQQREKDEKLQKEEEEDRAIREEIERDPQLWYQKMIDQRQELENIISKKQPAKMSIGRRQSQQNSIARMRAFIAVDDKDDSSFGMNDSDWKTYLNWGKEKTKTLEEMELAGIDAVIEKYWHLISSNVQRANSHDEPADNQIHMSVSLVRTPEIIFQPSLLGADQMGLGEVLYTLLSQRLSPHISHDIVRHVHLAALGGNMAYAGMKERIFRELTLLSPMFHEGISVTSPDDFILDPWRGAALYSQSAQGQATAQTLANYNECGIDYLIEKNSYFSANLKL